MNEEISTIVIDNGSGMCKVGFGGDDEPSKCFPNVIGRLPTSYKSNVISRFEAKDCIAGNEAITERGILKLRYPIERGFVINWDDMEKLWHHLFDDVLSQVKPEEHPVLLTECSMNTIANRQKMAQVMFETFAIPGLFIINPAYAALFARWELTGMVLDCGDGLTQALPIYQGYALPNSAIKLNFGGRDLTDYMERLVTEKGYYCNTTGELDVIREMKENVCYVAQNFDSEMGKDQSKVEKEFRFPDGQILSLGNQRFRCPEAMFQLGTLGIGDYVSLPELVVKSIEKCDEDIRDDLYANIVLSGGSTMFPEFNERFKKEIQALVHVPGSWHQKKIKVTTHSQRHYFPWTGASVLSTISTFKSEFISRQEYDETGHSIVLRKYKL